MSGHIRPHNVHLSEPSDTFTLTFEAHQDRLYLVGKLSSLASKSRKAPTRSELNKLAIELQGAMNVFTRRP